MVVPGKYNIKIQKGEDFKFRFDLKVGGVILDLTGATVLSQIRKSERRGSEKVIDFTCLVDDVATPNPAPTLNEISLNLTDVQTAGLEKCGGYYDVLVIDSAGNDTYYVKGRVTIEESVTVKP